MVEYSSLDFASHTCYKCSIPYTYILTFLKMTLEPTWNMLILVFESIVYEFCCRIVSQMRDLPGHARGYGDTRTFLTHP